MKRLLLLLILAPVLTLPAKAQQHVNLDSLYRVLEQAIDSADYFLKTKTDRIASLKDNLGRANSDQSRYDACRQIYTEYVPYANDSAIAYQYRCIELAKKLGRDDLRAEAEVALAYQLANSGFYNEARIHFDRVPAQYLQGELLNQFLSGKNHLYGEMAFYSHDPELKKEFFDRQHAIRDSLMARMDTTSTSWIALRAMVLNNQNRPEEAMHYSDRWLKDCKPNSRRYAIMSFYRSEIYKKLGNEELQRYWLIQAALIDIRNAIMDQGALWSLANSLTYEEGQLDRANEYINFSWQCLTRFSTHMRSWLVAPILTSINSDYKQRLERANTRLQWLLLLTTLLLLSLCFMLMQVHKKRRQLAVARDELKLSNDQLHSLNQQLQQSNEKLTQSNLCLKDANRVKDEYISKFFTICSDYIDKLDSFRLKVNRKVKTNQYADLLKMTSSDEMKEREMKEFIDNFDAVFLHLFPTFIDDFNQLLQENHRITPPEEGQLTTDLRIFALIRLGIDESSRIAEFLRYSPNSIYNYRARIKKNAIGNRDDFEQRVREIGITS